jgi:preprotein translocase subunit SecF
MTLKEALIDGVCEQRNKIPLLLAVVIVMGVLLAFSFLFLQPGTAAYVIALVDLLLVVGCLVVFGSTYWYCTKRAMNN